MISPLLSVLSVDTFVSILCYVAQIILFYVSLCFILRSSIYYHLTTTSERLLSGFGRPSIVYFHDLFCDVYIHTPLTLSLIVLALDRLRLLSLLAATDIIVRLSCIKAVNNSIDSIDSYIGFIHQCVGGPSSGN